MDMTTAIENQIERFAPGFRDTIIARNTMNTEQVEAGNPNYAGGEISAGAMTLRQTMFRPTLSWGHYATPNPKLYLCSASTPPGPGIHGMAGWNAAQMVLQGRLR
jgi:phytoene dehydrogenase-like protein